MQIHNSARGDSSPEGIPFRRAGGGQPLLLVPVRVNGTGPHEFILDTGAGTSLLSPALADRLEIPRTGSKAAWGAGGKLEVELATVASLVVGPAEARDLPVAITAEIDRIGAIVGAEIAGDVGYDVLKGFRVTIEYPQDRIRLERSASPPAGGGRESGVPFCLAHPEKPLVVVPAAVDGRGPYAFVLDGRLLDHSFPGARARARDLRRVSRERRRSGGTHRRARRSGAVARRGRGSRPRPGCRGRAFLGPLGDAVGTRLDGILGHNYLAGFRVAIDYLAGVVSVDAP